MSTGSSPAFLLIFRDTGPEVYERMTSDMRRELVEKWNAWYDGLAAQGKVEHGQPLEVTGRVVSGPRGERVSDGPYAEAKEVVGGYFYLRVANIDEATEIARQCPSLPHGLSVEIRQVASFSPVLRELHGRAPKSPAIPTFAPAAPGVDRTSPVTLREITEATLGDVLKLQVHPAQERVVASNAVSIAQAHYSPHAWFRAIHAGDVPVGFVMISDNAAKPEYWLWRFMIDARYQGLGFGQQALARIIEHVRTRPGATVFHVSCVEGEGSPIEFYRKNGFTPTGAYEEGEAVLTLPL